MRTVFFVLVMLSFGTASLIWGISGIGQLYAEDNPVEDNSASAERLEDESNESVASQDGEFEGNARTGEDDSLVGIIFSGISALLGFVKMVVLLPFELRQLGFPHYFAYPVGVLGQTIVGVGFVQFATGRVYR